MKTVLTISFAAACLCIAASASGQGVAINNSGADPSSSAMLDVSATNKGVLLPRMTKVQRNLITAPATGLLVYQTDSTPGLYYYSGALWQLVGTGSGPWAMAGSNIYNSNYPGNIGIGTSSPASKLDLRDTISGFTGKASFNIAQVDNDPTHSKTEPAMNITVTGTNPNRFGLKVTSDRTGIYSSAHNTALIGETTNGYGVYGHAIGVFGVGGFFTADSSNYALLVGDGNVGIGTDNPSGKVDIFADTGAALLVERGNVGIGTTVPRSKLDILDTFSAFTGKASVNIVQVDNDPTHAKTEPALNISVTGTNPNRFGVKVTSDRNGIYSVAHNSAVVGESTNGYGVVGHGTRAGGSGGYFSADSSGLALFTDRGSVGIGTDYPYAKLDIFADTGAALVVEQGKVGIGTLTPTEQLDVNGAVRIGTTTSSNVGTIRFNGTDFQGYTGTGWTNFGAGSSSSEWTISGSDIYNGNTGNVGVGTSTPAARLDVLTGGTYGLRSTNTGSGNFAVYGSSIGNNSTGVFGQGGIGAGSTGVEGYNVAGKGVFGHSVSGTGGYFSSITGNGIIVETGKSGFGTTTPAEMLDVNGGIHLGNTTTTNAGTMRFNGTNFQGYNGSSWTTFSSGGTSQWTTSGADIYNNNSGQVSIGSTVPDPTYKFAVTDPIGAISGISSGSGSTGIYGEGITYGIKALSTNGSAIYGNSVHGNGRVGSFNSGTGGYFASLSGYALITSGGNAGIGTNNPVQMLDVNGALHIGTTTSNIPGSIRYDSVAHQFQGHNGSSWINFGGGPSQWTTSGVNIYNNNSGQVSIGSSTPDPTYKFAVTDAIGAMAGISTGAGSTGIYGEGITYGIKGYCSNGSALYGNSVHGNGVVGSSNSGVGGYFGTVSGYSLITSGGNAGIGTNNPVQMLDVNGAIRLGTTTSNIQGSVKYDSVAHQFLGYNGTSWINLGGTPFNDTLTRNLYTNGYLVSADNGTGIKMYDNGTIVDSGTYGSGSDLVSSALGTRMIWYPKKAAFRAGFVTGSEWDNVNIGNYSAAFGNGCKASGTDAFAAGLSSQAGGGASIAMGNTAVATGFNGIALGNGVTANGTNSVALGTQVSTAGHNGSMALGDNNGYATTSNDADNQAMMRFTGGYRFYTNGPATQGAMLTSGGVMKYLTNVAASYDARSLVDKNYVDSSIAATGGGGGGSSPWATSGTNIYNSNTGKVSIGTNRTVTAKVLVQDSLLGSGFGKDVLDVKSYNYYAWAIKGEDMNTSSTQGGVLGTTTVGTGVQGQSFGNGYGVYGTSANGAGVYGVSTSGSTGFVAAGGYFEGNSGGYALVTGNGNVGIGTLIPSVKLEVCGNQKVNGNIQASGTITASAGITCPSDIRYKKEVKELDNTLANVMNMRGVSYFWKQNEFPSKEFTADKQIGVIAQEVEKIYPELVFTDKDGYKAVDYTRLAPILLEAIKAQQEEIEALKSKTVVLTQQAQMVADLTRRMGLLEASVNDKSKEGISVK